MVDRTRSRSRLNEQTKNKDFEEMLRKVISTEIFITDFIDSLLP